MNTLKLDNLTQEQKEQIIALAKSFEKKKWPNWRDEYFYIDNRKIFNCGWEEDEIDRGRLSIGNVFKTKEEAETKLNWLKSVQRVKDYIEREFGEFVPDWSDIKVGKFIIYYDYSNKRLGWDRYTYLKYYSPIGYLKSIEDYNQLIKDCKEDLEIIFK